jgi:hypothetical protein
MNKKLKVLFALASLMGLVPVQSTGNELTDRARAAMSLCNCDDPANREICSRLQMSGAMELDRSRPGSGQQHQGQRVPASVPNER